MLHSRFGRLSTALGCWGKMHRKIFIKESFKGSILLAICLSAVPIINQGSLIWVPLIFAGMVFYFLIIGVPTLLVWHFIFKKYKEKSCSQLTKSGFYTLILFVAFIYLFELLLSQFVKFSEYGPGLVLSFLLVALPGYFISCVFIGFKLQKQPNKVLSADK